MKKRIKRWLTMLMSLALILGSIQYTPMLTEAGGELMSASVSDNSSVSENDSVSGNVNARSVTTPTTRYYTFKEVSNAGGYGYTESISDAGVLTAGFTGQYQEVRYSLPEGVDASTLTKLTLDVTSDNVSSLAIKILVDGIQKQVVYETNTIDITEDLSTGNVTFAIMNKASDALEGVIIDNICITAVQTGGSETEPIVTPTATAVPGVDPTTRYYTFKEVTNAGGYGYTESISDAGVLTVDFIGQYQEVRYTFPEGVDVSTLKKLTLDVSSGYVSSLAIKILVDGIQKQVVYETNTINITEDLSSGTVTFAIMNKASDALEGVVVDNICITAVQTGGSETEPETAPETAPAATATPAPTAAPSGEASTKYYTFNDVSAAGGYGYVADVTEAGTLDIAFEGQYQEVKYNLPEGVDGKTIKNISFHITEGDVSNLAIKVYADGTQSDVTYENNTITVSSDLSGAEEITFALMNKGSEAVSFIIDYFTITAVQTGGSETAPEAGGEVEETYEITYGYSDLTLDWTNGTCELVEGGYLVNFSALNEEARFKLPETINLENCKSITYRVASQNGPINLYVGSDGTKLKSYWYKEGAEAYTVAPEVTNKINTIGVQCAGETYTENASVIVTGVTFVMKGKKPLPTPTDGVYNMNYFSTDNATEGVAAEVNEETGTATVTFAGVGDAILLTVPDSVDVNHLVSIVLNGSGLENVTIEALDKEEERLLTANEETIETKCNPEVKYIKLTSTQAGVSVSLDNIFFEVNPEAFEAIVLNGNFAREDVSMWGAALWGSVDGVDTTITAEVSDTPIFKDVYTYGHVSDRSSPYVCFAQDITDRVKKGQWYEVNFWVRLDAEDYKDAGTVMREITCSPYCLDENGKEYYGLIPSGHYKQSMDAGVWTNMVCKIYVPLYSTGYVLRIVEQGTSYGQGNCVMGSYDITGVTMTECDAPVAPKSSSGGSATTNTTVTKEASWTGEYNMEDLLVEWASADYEKTGSNGLNITFDSNYDEVRMDLPRELDMSTAAYVKAKVSGQNVPIAVKLYYKGSQVDVGYFNDIKSEYTLVPSCTGMVDAIGIMSIATPNPADAYVNFESITFGLTEEPAPLPVRTEIVLNGDFSDADLSDWKASFWGDGVTMTQKTSSTAIAPGVYNYASYSKRTSPYQCFAQDITDMVEEGETYTFSFWAKLSEDYEGAPEAQRIIQFAPYTTDSDGVSDYNPKLEGNYLQVCEPGEWTYFEGTYKVTNPNDVKKVVIRILEQGTNYGQGECVLGGYSVADVKMAKYIPEPPSIDEDVPNLKDVLPETFGEDFLIGTAVTLDEIDDIGVEMLVNKHFNAITLGNELKPDALFNYSNSAHTDLQTITFHGGTLEVPTLSFYRAEEILDKILEWNDAHPEAPIKVRGHVLVWHSQTPEWFFREGYVVAQNADGTENYVTPEVMNLRLEWYIKTVLEHFTGEDSKYKDLFYGWDVVNEAVSNGGNGYRTDKVSSMESPGADTHSNNSSWWAVYQSNEFIINAFKYANMYAPAEVELYYNDYNECDNKKMAGIVKLLRDVKEAEDTRIDGMGMQAHYNMFNPSMKAFETAIRAYAEVVGKVMITEWDMKVSGSIDNDEKKQAEYLAQGERYRDFYEVLKALDAEEGIEIGGITFWGTVDHYSWLQESSSVGGGADGDLTQCPLLFGDDYKVKPSYWAFVDYSVIDPDYVAPILVGAQTEDEKEDDKSTTEDTSGETEKTQDPAAEATPEPEKQEANASATEAPKADAAEEGNNVVPIAVGGGVVGVGIIGAVVAWLKKRKKVS